MIGIAFAFAIVGQNPAAWAQARWYDARGALVQLRDTDAQALPPDSAAEGFSAAALVDADRGTAWATPWEPPPEGATCGKAPGGKVRVTFDSARLKQIRVFPGLDDPSLRSLQQLPAGVDVTFPDGTCLHMPLTEKAEEQRLDIDSETPIKSIEISVPNVHESTDDRAAEVVGLTNVALFSRP
ncbi:MAG: hypothetical protein WBG89_02195 [Ornithinimicrobium sp.]